MPVTDVDHLDNESNNGSDEEFDVRYGNNVKCLRPYPSIVIKNVRRGWLPLRT